MAHHEPSHLDVHCLPFCLFFFFFIFFFFFTDILFAMTGMPKLKDGSVHFRNSGVKGLIEKGLCSCLHRAGPEVIKLFFMLNSAEHEIFSANTNFSCSAMLSN